MSSFRQSMEFHIRNSWTIAVRNGPKGMSQSVLFLYDTVSATSDVAKINTNLVPT